MKQKVKIISSDIVDGESVYVIFFIHTQSKSIIFLAYTADIDAICYSSNPSLPGSVNYELAKRYKSIEEAKNDIYKLRYHHREFLKVMTGIKEISIVDLDIGKIENSDTITYNLIDLT